MQALRAQLYLQEFTMFLPGMGMDYSRVAPLLAVNKIVLLAEMNSNFG